MTEKIFTKERKKELEGEKARAIEASSQRDYAIYLIENPQYPKLSTLRYIMTSDPCDFPILGKYEDGKEVS